MTSTVKLYYDTKILADRNMLIENIEDYLSTLTPTVMEDFQYIKHDLSVTIKFDTSFLGLNVQASNILNPWKDGKINYVSIQNETDTKPIYYYVIDSEWIGKCTLKLYLAMDTLNTFNGAYSFDKKTVVTREHKDRYYPTILQIEGISYLPRKLYLDSDNIQPTLYNKEEHLIEDYANNYDWYLLYMANNTTGATEGKDYPVNAYLISEQDIVVGLAQYALDTSTLDTANVYWFGKNVTNSFTQGNVYLPNGNDYEMREAYFLIYVTSTKTWTLAYATGGGGSKSVATGISGKLTFDEIKNIDVTAQSSVRTILQGTLSTIGGRISSARINSITPTKIAGSQGVNGIETVDRTDTRILGIIKLPYCPVKLDLSQSEPILPAEVTKTEIEWLNKNKYAYFQIKSNYLSGFERSLEISKGILTSMFVKKSDITNTRNDYTESALYRSDYYQQRFVYDSFSYTLQNELLDKDFLETVNGSTDPLEIKMVTTSTMNSRFLFDFNNQNKGFIYANKQQDYPYILNIARNNNIATYNSEYVNYMRNGYNYDVKAKNASIVNASLGIAANAINFGSSIFPPSSLIANLINSSEDVKAVRKLAGNAANYRDGASTAAGVVNYIDDATQRVAKNATASQIAISNIFGSVSSLINNINTIRQTENTFEQKQKQMAQASVSVAGSDDIDLLSYYSGNRMKLETWTCSDRMKKALADLYYYQGYSTNEQKVPDTTTRKNFNFIQCNAVLTNEKNLDDKYIENLKERYAIGVTVLHKYNNTWDWDQTSGNLETFL